MNTEQLLNNMTKYELEKEVEWLRIVIKQLEAEKDILWEYISDKDIDEIYVYHFSFVLVL